MEMYHNVHHKTRIILEPTIGYFSQNFKRK
jgi:hypothetical protein